MCPTPIRQSVPGTPLRVGVATVFGSLHFFKKSLEGTRAYLPILIKSDINKAAGNQGSQRPFLLGLRLLSLTGSQPR